MAAVAAVAFLLPATASAADSIYWGNESGAVRVGPLDGSLPAQTLAGGTPCGVAIDPAAGKIYWANWSSGEIMRADLDGGQNAEPVYTGQNNPCGVAIDPTAGKIYWASFGDNAIRAGNLNGTDPAQTLFTEDGGSAPSGVAIDPAAGKIYWTNQFSDQVRVGPLDGLGPAQTLFGNGATVPTVERNPIGVAIDPAAGKIYWTDLGNCCSGPGQVRVGNLDGTGASTLFADEAGPGGLSIDPGANKIYWATFGPGVIRVGPLSGDTSPDPSDNAQTLFSGESASLFTALLKAPAPAPAEPPEISEGAGGELACSEGSWAPDLLGAFLYRAPHDFTYQWQKDGTDISGADQSTFTPSEPGSYTCKVTASNHAGETTSEASEPFNVQTLGIEKFYDANANGQFDAASENPIAGWKVRVDDTAYLTPQSLTLDPGGYLVTESNPVQTNWFHTTARLVQVSLAAGDEKTVEFGNVCVGAGGALSTGTWSNKNGQALFGADDLAQMVSLNLRDANGSTFDPTSYTRFKNWLSGATATNMAYKLSAQLAAMKLNVYNGKVDGSSLIYAPGTSSANANGFATVSDVMAEANNELALHGLTKSGSPFRSHQTALNDALDKANNNLTFVKATPCAFTFP